MEREGEADTSPGRRAYALAAASLRSSVASFIALGLYGRWHAELFFPPKGTPAPDWLTGRVIDAARLVSVIFAIGAVPLAIFARRTGLLGGLALLAAAFALMTMPLIM